MNTVVHFSVLIVNTQYKILLSDVYNNKIYLFTVDKQLKNQNLVTNELMCQS